MEHFLKDSIREAGELALSFYGTDLSYTSKSESRDIVTKADVAVSDFLVSKIRDAYPGHSITSEEIDGTLNAGAEYEWIIDPIDGTQNFAHRIPFWCVIVALVRNGRAELGAMYNPLTRDLFFARRGAGAFLNDERLRVSRIPHIDRAKGIVVQANEAGTYGVYVERYRAALMKMAREHTPWVGNYYSVLSLGYLASGGFDFQLGNAGMDWDFVAPFLLCEEAGAVVTDSDGNPWQRGRQDYVVANAELHSEIMRLFEL